VKLIVSLGNPGNKYINTRHNAGHLFLDFLNKNSSVDVKTYKSTLFMNDSGVDVKRIMDYYKISPSDLIVAHDDLDITLGEFKIDFGKGPKVHNGILSVEEKLKTKDFYRVRIGIEDRDLENKIPGEEYVLGNFTQEQLGKLNSVFERLVMPLEEVIKK
jgi:peptidyl-tRNA hydrolase, PTH1 family